MKNLCFWFANTILKPLFGEAWLEVTAILLLVILVGLIATTVIFAARYAQLSNTYENVKNQALTNADKNRYLSQDKQDLEASLAFVKTQLEEKIQLVNDTESKYVDECKKVEELNAVIASRDLEIEELNKKVKKSESAKKAAETRKKNKEINQKTDKIS